MRKRVHAILVAALFVSLLSGITVAAITPASAAVACDAGVAAQNGVTVAPKHGRVFYVDSGQGQNVDAAYVGYKITAGSTLTNVWAKLDTFTGGVVSLANPSDANLPVGNISAGSSQTAFFLLKAKGSTLSAQAHTIHVYSGQPGLTGATELYSCTFTFTKVAETIKAAANKLDTNNAITVTSTSVLGGTVTIVVQGATGTIGAGPSSDPNMMWISPASRSSWPTSALRLTSTQVQFWTNSGKGGGADATYLNQLQVGSLSSIASKLYYTATYVFKIIGKSSSAAAVAPIAQITSGTQVKHTDMVAVDAKAATVSSDVVTINASVTKNVGTGISQVVTGKTRFNYTITLTNSASTGSAITFDSVIDTPASGLTYVASSVRISVGSTTAEPLLDSSNKLVFSQPISVRPGIPVLLTYSMDETSACSGAFTYANSAVAKIGTITLGATASTYSNVSATGTCGGSTATVTVTTPTIPVEVQTQPATSIGNTSAILNATIDPNGSAGSSVFFEYGTSSTLSSFTSVTLGALTSGSTASYAVSTTLNSLSTATSYYYRVRIGTVYGDILSFTTTEPVAVPTVITNLATSVTTATATLNSTVDPNQTAVYVEYEVSSSSTLDSGVTIVRLIDDPSAVWESGVNDDSTFASSSAIFPQLIISSGSTLSHLISGSALTTFIVNGNTVYFRARTVAVTGGTVTTASTIRSFTFGTYTEQTITFAAISDISVGSAAPIIAPITTGSALTVSVTSSTTSVCTISGFVITIVTAGTCTLAADQSGNSTYSPAEQVLQSFTVNLSTYTVTFDGNGFSAGSTAAQSANTPTALTSNGFTRTGYTFANWNTSASGSGTSYANAANYPFTSSVTLYARWNSTLTFDGNTSTGGSTAAQTADTSTVLTSNGFTKTNYTFAGWSTTSGSAAVAYSDGASYPFTGGAATLYAQWTLPTFSVSYDGNSSTGGSLPDTSTVNSGATFTLSSGSSITKTSYTFSRWNTVANGSGTYYAASDTLTVSSAIVFYAQWNATVTFNANGGTDSNYTQTADKATALTTNGFSRSNYSFGGWSVTAGSASVSYANLASYPFNTGASTLYAQWTGVTYTTTFNYNGATSDSSTVSSNYITGGTAITLPTPTKTGYTFAGWFSETGLTTSIGAGGASYSPTSSATIYAAWSSTVTFNANGGTGSDYTQVARVATNLTANTFTRTSFTFASWNTASGGSGTSYANSASYPFSAGATTLYALWTAAATFTVSYNGNSNTGGTAPSASTFTVGGTALTLPSIGTLLRSGFTFEGWSTSTSGSAVGSPYTPPSSLTLFAVWTAVAATPTPTPSLTPTIIKPITQGVSIATENGVQVATTIKLIPSAVTAEKPKAVEVSGDGWKIQIIGSKDVVQGTPLDPSSISIVLVQGVDATTNGFGFKPGTIARVYLFSTPILLGETLVKADGTFKATFPVSVKIPVGPHTMQVEGIATSGVQRKADVGLLVQANLAKKIMLLDRIYYTTNFYGLIKVNNDKLNAVAKKVKTAKYKKIWLYGYTDIVTGVDNTWLSRQRANTAKTYLQKLLPNTSFQIKYFGPANPAAKAKTKAAFALNRRVEIYVQK